jgi:alkanesulfonate monooxygenase SsuD/methylene tetrahydromethanopterin reductase-like flavin-dependent oxidoreductase (luciferase family)
MPIPFNIGVLQLSMEPVRETVAMAKACEDAGFDAFWIAEAYPWWRKHSFEARSSTAVLAVIAAETRRIQLGWGIISPYTRHPVQIAMEARVMQDLASDRFLLGLGASKIFMKEIGEGEGEKVGPATVMRESVEIIKGVLAGDAFEYQGKVFQANVPPLKPDGNRAGAAENFWRGRRRIAHGQHYDAGVCSLLTQEYGRRGEQGRQRPVKARAGFGDRRKHSSRFGEGQGGGA